VLPIAKRLFALGERYLNAANADVRNLAYAFFVHNQHFFRSRHTAKSSSLVMMVAPVLAA